MKYQYYVLGRCISKQPIEWEWRARYVPVEERDGKRVVCGQHIDISHLEGADQCMSYAYEFDENDDAECSLSLERAVGIEVPDGWQLMADFPLPDNYVPESMEVRGESRQRAIEHLRKLGVWRD